MKTYKISEPGITAIRKKSLKGIIIFGLLAGTAGLGISFFSLAQQGKASVDVLFIVLPAIVIAWGVGAYIGVKRKTAQLRSYTLEWDDQRITRTQQDTPTISLHFSDIQTIHKRPNGDIYVHGGDAKDVIIIPSQLADYDEVESALSDIKEFSQAHIQSFYEKYNRILTGVVVVSMAVLYLAENKIAVLLAGMLTIGIIGYGAYDLKNSKQVDERTKRNLGWVIFLIVAMAGIMVGKLMK